MTKSFVWEVFVPVASPMRQHEAPAADADWLVARGIEWGSPTLLLQLRDEIAPVLADMTLVGKLIGFSFLIHGSNLAPVPDDLRDVYAHESLVHIRARFRESEKPAFPAGWLWARPIERSTEIAGLDLSVIEGGHTNAWEGIEEQSMWLLGLLVAHKQADGFALVKNVRQFLHFFANMAQMRVA